MADLPERLTAVDERRDRPFHAYLRVRCAAYLLAYDGRVQLKNLRTFLRQHGVDAGSIRRPDGKSDGSRAGRVLNNCMRELVDERLVRRDGDFYVVTDLADLAAWLADEVDDNYDPPPAGPPPLDCEDRQ